MACYSIIYRLLLSSEAIHQRILLYNKSVITWAMTNKLLYSKVLTKLLYSKE